MSLQLNLKVRRKSKQIADYFVNAKWLLSMVYT